MFLHPTALFFFRVDQRGRKFRKQDLSNQSQQIRASALRAMASIKVLEATSFSRERHPQRARGFEEIGVHQKFEWPEFPTGAIDVLVRW